MYIISQYIIQLIWYMPEAVFKSLKGRTSSLQADLGETTNIKSTFQNILESSG